uniref:Uncharacterized protein n=1 Tax=Arundo donax TaxID=35708 RepID=A0A0A9BV88_ARUDO
MIVSGHISTTQYFRSYPNQASPPPYVQLRQQ